MDCLNYSSNGGIPITSMWTSCSDQDLELSSEAKYIVVIEKEGVFHRLCEDKFYM